MKTLLQKFSVSMLALSMVLSMGISASAVDVSASEKSGLALALSNYITSLESKETLSAVQIVESFFQDDNRITLSLQDGDTAVEVIEINESNRIIIKGDTILAQGLTDVEATPDRIAQGAVDVSNKMTRTAGTTPIKRAETAMYNGFGSALWTLVQEAQFTYTGSSVTVNYADGYYEKGFLSVWQVSNFEDSVQSSSLLNNVWTKRVRSSGNFHWGVEYDGNGLVFDDVFAWAELRCTVNGYVYADYNS